MIEVREIRKCFADEEVLHGITAQFEKGLTNLIIGRSGSGKTVLMKCIVGLLEPDGGEVLYDGRNLHRMTRNEQGRIKKEIGMLFQGAALFDQMNVMQNVLFPLEMFSSANQRERKARASYCLERVGMLEAASKMPDELSGGMQKRVAIARAIALEPKYLFCDEPNSGLDPVTSLTIDELIHSITHEANITTVINTHDMNSVRGIGENILFIHEGNAEWKGTNQDLSTTSNPLLRQFIAPQDEKSRR